MNPRERLIVALDVPSVDAAQAMVARLGGAVSFYKIGYQLAFAGGLDYARDTEQDDLGVGCRVGQHDGVFGHALLERLEAGGRYAGRHFRIDRFAELPAAHQL